MTEYIHRTKTEDHRDGQLRSLTHVGLPNQYDRQRSKSTVDGGGDCTLWTV